MAAAPRLPARLLRLPGAGAAALLVLGVALLAWLLVGLATFREALEKNAVDVTLRNIASGLRLTVAEAMLRGTLPELARLPGSNPVAMLAGPPAGYLGERRGAPPAPPASWYFDAGRGELVYVPRLERHLVRAGGGAAPLRWKIVAAKGAAPAADDTRTEGLVLVAVTPYAWF